jgi:sphingomyelin phosphodiesterase
MTIGTRTSTLFCLTVFGLCQWPNVEAYNVSLSAKPNTTRPNPSGETPIQIVHISDIHVDLFYETGASYNCTKNICCRPYTTNDEPSITDYPTGEYGNHACDSPLALEQSLYAAIESLVPNRAFTQVPYINFVSLNSDDNNRIFTGDVVEGAVWLMNGNCSSYLLL